MKRLTDRRKILFAAGTAAAVAVAGSVAAQPGTIHGIVGYEGGAAIPKGRLEITLEDSARSDVRSAAAKASIEAAGKSRSVAFSLPSPAGFSASPTQEITVQLMREDGWLLARGSAPISMNGPTSITLYEVMY